MIMNFEKENFIKYNVSLLQGTTLHLSVETRILARLVVKSAEI
jgi:hypothetical protein